MKRIARLVIIVFILYCSPLVGQITLYVSPDGSTANDGTSPVVPTTFQRAVQTIVDGGTIHVAEGTYHFTSTVVLNKNGSSAASRIKVFAASGTPVFDFSAQADDSSNRGIVLEGDFWYVKGLVIQGAGDNGMLLSGNGNIIQECVFRNNRDTGLQLSRSSGSAVDISQWPSDNFILDCESYDNKDADNEDADGFAAKLTCGTGNVFLGCVAHHNIDDGWDLFTKVETGPIGAVTLKDCIAHGNGTTTDGATSGNGDKNGFKMGGENIPVNHVMQRCIAFNNGKHGITYNRNLGMIEVSNCTAYGNTSRNFNFGGGNHVFINNLSYRSGSGDQHTGDTSAPNVFANGFEWGFEISDDDFQSLTPAENRTPTSNGFLHLNPESDAVDSGVNVPGLNFTGSAPDLGAVEFEGVVSNAMTIGGTQGIVQVFPNPARDYIHVNFLVVREGDFQVTLRDWAGRKVEVPSEDTGEGVAFLTHGVPAGKYLIAIRNGSRYYGERVIIQD